MALGPRFCVVVWLGACRCTNVAAQVPENPLDPTGVAIPYPHVHLFHSASAQQLGATAHLRATDPFLFYQLGRDMLHRQYTLAQGAYGRAAFMDIPLHVSARVLSSNRGSDVRFARDHASSCGMCHSMPYREPGGGQTIPSTGGLGRNTPHFYGAGLMEMLGDQINRQILNRYDRNRNGIIDIDEISAPMPVRIVPFAGAEAVDFGDLSPDTHGVPMLNPAFRVWYVDAAGDVIASATSLHDSGVRGFGFSLQVFGWGRGVRILPDERRFNEGGEASTLRGIFSLAADFHMGMQAFDPTQQIRRSCEASQRAAAMGGYAEVSLNGMQQVDFGGSVDCGRRRTDMGLSLDDPDGDGKITEFTEGDLDAIEFYMLNAPPPAYLASRESEAGRKVFLAIGCQRCHVENWQIEARDNNLGYAGDRRFFHLATRSLAGSKGPALSGSLSLLFDQTESGAVAKRGAFPVDKIYTDFKHWDLGSLYCERRFDGSLQREHRTAPLWGVGSTAPYGHAGQFDSMEDAILAHGGEAGWEARAFRALAPTKRRLLLAFLRALVLYPTEEIPADIDGDGVIADYFRVAGQSVGYERFNARFLFRSPPRYQALFNMTNDQGRVLTLLVMKNVAEAYGLELPFRKCSRGDGFPDVMHAPQPVLSRRMD